MSIVCGIVYSLPAGSKLGQRRVGEKCSNLIVSVGRRRLLDDPKRNRNQLSLLIWPVFECVCWAGPRVQRKYAMWRHEALTWGLRFRCVSSKSWRRRFQRSKVRIWQQRTTKKTALNQFSGNAGRIEKVRAIAAACKDSSYGFVLAPIRRNFPKSDRAAIVAFFAWICWKCMPLDAC